MAKFKSHDHYANQKGMQQVFQKGQKFPKAPGKSAKPTSPMSNTPRQAEEAVSPGTDTSNGGM